MVSMDIYWVVFVDGRRQGVLLPLLPALLPRKAGAVGWNMHAACKTETVI